MAPTALSGSSSYPPHTHRRGWSGSTALDWQGCVSRHNLRAHRCPWHSTCPAHIRWKGIKKPSETSETTTAEEKGREGEQNALHVTVSCPRGARLNTQVGLRQTQSQPVSDHGLGWHSTVTSAHGRVASYTVPTYFLPKNGTESSSSPMSASAYIYGHCNSLSEAGHP